MIGGGGQALTRDLLLPRSDFGGFPLQQWGGRLFAFARRRGCVSRQQRFPIQGDPSSLRS
jgi:hypothetical protein